jgi:glutathione S-transferase
MPTLYESHPSGNCYKVRLICHKLGIPLELVHLDIAAGATRTPEFRALNPIGKVPTLKLDDGTVLAESNAILWYFAEGTPYLPSEKLARARVLSWMFFEQYSHEPYIAVARAWRKFFGIPAGKERDLEERMQKGYAALDVLEGELSQRPFIAGDRYTIADIALYAYTHVADEGGFDLLRYGRVRDWLARVAAEPRHVRITD